MDSWGCGAGAGGVPMLWVNALAICAIMFCMLSGSGGASF